MQKIKLRYAQDDMAFLEQECDSETLRISITRHELRGIVHFLKNPTEGRYRFYSRLPRPVMIRFNSEDDSYLIERAGVQLFGSRTKALDDIKQAESSRDRAQAQRAAFAIFKKFVGRLGAQE